MQSTRAAKTMSATLAGADDRLLRHITACNNAALPGRHVPVRLGGLQVGWFDPIRFDDVAGLVPRAGPDGIDLVAEQLAALARGLADRGLIGFRGEDFDVRADPDGEALGRLDRGALPMFGIWAEGVHLNGLVRRSDGLFVWVARRAAHKALDPGLLDHIAAGGVPAGLTAWQTLIKEAEEEASIPAELARRAVPVATISYAMQRPEGLRRDRLRLYDLDLPEAFMPIAADGEVASFELWPIAQVFESVRDGDAFKFNVNVALIDLFLRQGVIPPSGHEAAALRAALNAAAI